MYNLSASAWKTCTLFWYWEEVWNQFRQVFSETFRSGEVLLFCFQIRICFILQSALSLGAKEDWKSGKCTGVYW